MHGDEDPGPPIGGLGVAQAGLGPAEGLLGQAEHVLDVETAQVGSPEAVDVAGSEPHGRRPQPQRLGGAVTGQPVDSEADDGAFYDGQLAGVVLPSAAAGQLGVAPVPGGGVGGAVPAGRGAGGDVGGRVGAGLVEVKHGAVPTGPAGLAGDPGRRRLVEDPVGLYPAQHLHGQVRQQEGQAGQVVAGVERDQDRRVARLVLARPPAAGRRRRGPRRR